MTIGRASLPAGIAMLLALKAACAPAADVALPSPAPASNAPGATAALSMAAYPGDKTVRQSIKIDGKALN
jgi:hypothetical protein